MITLWLLALRAWRWLGAASVTPALARKILIGALCAAWLVTAIWGGWGWHRHARAQKQLAAAEATIARIEAAQAAAATAQATINHAPAAASAAIAKESNHEAPAYYAGVRRAADAHAVRLRGQAADGATGGADLPGADPAEQGVHGPAGSAGLVCRPASEDGQLVGAAARAAEMHREALDLIAAGVAVAEPENP